MNPDGPDRIADTSSGALGAGSSPLLSDIPVPQIPDYEVLKKIGGGSYGDVWLVRSTLGTYRAAKVVYRRSFEHVQAFEREFKGIQRFEPISLTHESQVKILHVGRNDAAGYFYYVMELADPVAADARRRGASPAHDAVEGKSGEQVGRCASKQETPSCPPTHLPTCPPGYPLTYEPLTLRQMLRDRCRLSVEECLQVGLSLTTALAHLHERGLIHRDVKPSNIIFVNGVPKLADIGLVTDLEATRSFVGTEGFIPPEGPGTVQADLLQPRQSALRNQHGPQPTGLPGAAGQLGRPAGRRTSAPA